MKRTIYLPTELWILVLGSLGFSDLKAVSSTCRKFRSLAISRLFRRLSIHISSRRRLGWNVARWRPITFSISPVKPMTLSVTNALLGFYGSEHIAPVVREFWLVGYVDKPPPPLQPDIEAILDLLRRLSNVRSVGFMLSDITSTIMQTIAQLPALASVIMDSCMYHHSEKPLFRLKDVSLFRHYSSYEEGTWPFTVQPELLESLHVDGTTFPNFSSLPNLRTLYVQDHDFSPVIQCLEFLVRCHCPSLDTLILPRCHGMDGGLATFDRSTLPMIPRLKNYHGPRSFVPLLAAGGVLYRASLWDTVPHAPAPERFAGSLDTLHALAPNLVALTIDIICPSEVVSHAITRFRSLEELYLKTRDRELELGPMQHFFAALDSQLLPPTLRQVEIRTRVRSRTGNLYQQDVMNAMRTGLSLPYVLKKAVERGEFVYAYTRHTRGAIIDDAVVDPREEWGSDDSDADSDTTY